MSYTTQTLPGYWGKMRRMTTWAWQNGCILHAALMKSEAVYFTWFKYRTPYLRAKAVIIFDRTLNGRE